MDRRTLIFLILLSVSFFSINSFFGTKQGNRPQQTSIAIKSSDGDETPASINHRIAQVNELPLADLYSDAHGQAMAVQALRFDDAYLFYASDKELPETLYTSSGDALTLLIPGKYGEPTAYTLKKESPIPSAFLPQVGGADLQFITFTESGLHVALGIYQDNALTFPLTPPQSNALVLYQSEGVWLPVGYFTEKDRQFHNLSSSTAYESRIALKTAERRAISQDYYILENDYQQVVFSTVGASIVEINLPFSTKDNKSVVRPIEFDREIAQKYKDNDTFPNFSAWKVNENGSRVQIEPTTGGYYPLLRRSLKDSGGIAYATPAQFYTLNVLSDDPDLAQARYSVKSFTQDAIEFETQLKGRRITKRFALPKERVDVPYVIEASVKVDGDARGLWISTGIPEVELISNHFTPALKYRTSTGNKPQVEKISLPKKESMTYSHIQPDWISNSNGFFALILDPLSQPTAGLKAEMIPGNFDPTRLTLIDASHDLYPASKYPGYNLLLPLKPTSQWQTYRLYAGPLERDILKQVDAVYSDAVTGYDPDYKTAISFHGWFAFISEPFAKFLFLLMSLFYSFTKSWGLSIILLTVALRIMLYPLNAWSIKSNLKMKEVAPKVTAIQQKHKKEPTRAQMEIMQLYKESGVNPFSGCLPLLIQMPFLVGMFDLLKSSFELRGASFIPGWIDNLTAPDVLFSWNFPIIFIGTQFHLLPILLGITMFIQQKWMQGQSKGMPQTDQQRQTQGVGNLMTLVFTFMFYRFPSGLNLYWISSMALSIVQQVYMNKRFEGQLLTQKKSKVVVLPKSKKNSK